ncbi:ATPase [Arsenicitalea aurantiaca]|uniref:ATPase n=1 Tax=Arsenicitalea aurantiaca TaxID=1783274 RepID=A0A433XAB8_9HYPH|nr:DUF6456 domain-containing protein [Arsenicitalea aurantiaca]RUT31026.1 ATPase [Arsenicitalea aurantiaca]
MSPDLTLKFMRVLLRAEDAVAGPDGRYLAAAGSARATLDAALVRGLLSCGAIAGDARAVRANAETRSWIRRRLASPGESEQVADRVLDRSTGGLTVNLAESPLARLAVGLRGDAPFLEAHQVEAGERLRRLWEKASLSQRVTMRYDGSPRAPRGIARGLEPGESAIDARKKIARIREALPPDCAGVVIDVCGLLKGLQTVEAERGWPRRSAKLVLRIGLDQLARHFGISAVGQGLGAAPINGWMAPDGRPDRFE